MSCMRGEERMEEKRNSKTMLFLSCGSSFVIYPNEKKEKKM